MRNMMDGEIVRLWGIVGADEDLCGRTKMKIMGRS